MGLGHPAARHAKLPGEEIQQLGIGLAIHRGRVNADFEVIALYPHEFAAFGPGLGQYAQDQVLPVPAEPGDLPAQRINPWPSTSRGCRISICIRPRARKTRRGEKSMPPVAGSKRRAGRIRGSVRRTTRFKAGLCWV
jgi:hypothetical protein